MEDDRESFGSGSPSVVFKYLKRAIFTLNAVTSRRKCVLYIAKISMCIIFVHHPMFEFF